VATPLGNLRDITLRALDVLASVAAVAAEDTRRTRQLLSHYQISVRLIALHEHNEGRAAQELVALLSEGKPVAYVTDAGTPGISDPGALLVSRVRAADLRVIPVPGPSAVTAALSAAGMSAQQFLFYGFLSPKAARRREELIALSQLPYTLVFYEAPHRLASTFGDMERYLGPQRLIVIAREISKLFEAFHRCTLSEVQAWLAEDPNHARGEFVLVVQGAIGACADQSEPAQRALDVLLRELPLKQAVHLAAEISGTPRKAMYKRALELKRRGDWAEQPGTTRRKAERNR
jgi:16S rRNA (cytidine1402-2'-O)-methyltransferase